MPNPQPSGFNVGLIAPQVSPQTGSNPHLSNTHVKVAEGPVVVGASVSPNYDDAARKEAVEEKTKPKPEKKEAPKTETKEEKSRHDKWKEDQARAKAEREDKAYQKKVERAKTAPELLRKGDVFGAAQALGISVSELISLTNKAAVGIPTKEEELTPEQKKERDHEEYRKKTDAQLQWMQQEHQRVTQKSWIAENIKPHVDPEKYPLITAKKEAVAGLMDGLYSYFNQKYLETTVRDDQGNIVKAGFTPNEQDVQDALETLEKQYEDQAEQTIAHYKGISKFKKHFTAEEKEEQRKLVEEANETELPVQLEDMEEQGEDLDPRTKSLVGSLSKAKPNNFNLANAKKEDDSKYAWALMSAYDKAEYIKAHPEEFGR